MDMRFEVPQFIEIEDKIFGPFTWKQFVYLIGGAGAGFMLYMLLPFIAFIAIAGPIMALSGGLAFFKVNNRPFSAVLESFFHYITSSRLYLWQKITRKTIQKTDAPAQTYLPPSTSTLASMSRKLEINALQNKR